MLQLGPVEPSADIVERLQLDARNKVLVRSRRYFADDVPVELATSYIPWRLAKGTAIEQPDSGPGGIYARLERSTPHWPSGSAR